MPGNFMKILDEAITSHEEGEVADRLKQERDRILKGEAEAPAPVEWIDLDAPLAT